MRISTSFCLREVDSTNAFAQRWIAENGLTPEDSRLPALITAEIQTAGRGQREHTWHSPRGCLMFTLAFSRDAFGLPMARTPLVGLSAAMALVDTLRGILPETLAEQLNVRWPNDVYFQQRKLSGVLVEGLANGILVLGMGVNLYNTAQDAPEELRSTIATLRDIAPDVAAATARETFLNALLERFDHRLRQAAWETETLVADLNAICAQKGQQVRLSTSQGEIHGFCVGLSPDGAILIDGRAFYSGTVVK